MTRKYRLQSSGVKVVKSISLQKRKNAFHHQAATNLMKSCRTVIFREGSSFLRHWYRISVMQTFCLRRLWVGGIITLVTSTSLKLLLAVILNLFCGILAGIERLIDLGLRPSSIFDASTGCGKIGIIVLNRKLELLYPMPPIG